MINPSKSLSTDYLAFECDCGARAEVVKASHDGPVRLNFIFYAPKLERRLLDYIGGVMDTLDGSHGMSFTYLPIVYQDDCQIVGTEKARYTVSKKTRYLVEIIFLSSEFNR